MTWVKKSNIRGPAGLKGIPAINGRNGLDGKDAVGQAGADGNDAPTIIDIEIVEKRGDWALQVTMSDGSRLLTNWVSSPKQKPSYIGGGGGYSADPASTSSGNGVVGKDGADGKSAYQIWLENSHTGSQSDFLNSLIGPKGADGKSAYQIWLDNGNTGTEQDFLNSLKANSNASPDDNNLLLNIPCALDVYVNSVVRMSIDDFIDGTISDWLKLSDVLQMRSGTYRSVAVNALADQYKNCNVIGIVEKKVSPQVCNIRIGGITSDIFYGLDVTEEYFLSDVDAGKIVPTPQAPQNQGAVLLRVGQPISYSELLFQRGDRLVRGISS